MFAQLIALPKARLYWLASVLVVLIGALDWVTGPDVALSVFYLLPIALIAWSAGMGPGLTTALASGAVWLWVEVSTMKPSHPAIPYWNGFVRTSVFCIVGWTISLVANRTRALQALNGSLAQRVDERNAALRAQTDLLESILGSIGEGVVVADMSGKVIRSNSAACRILGMDPGTSEPGSADGSAGRWAPLESALLGDHVDGDEVTWRSKDDGPIQWLVVTCRPVSMADGAQSGTVVVFRDITERRLLERQVAEVGEREQRRLGADLHDGVCQELVGIAFGARLLADSVAQSDPHAFKAANEILEQLNSAITHTREVARGLYLVGLEEDGLVAALDQLAARIRARHGIRCAVCSHSTEPVVDPVTARELFRIAQEAVANALKHGKPTHVQITLDVDENRILLCVENDGTPMAPEISRGTGMGLQMMRHRARLIGGTIGIDSSGPGGTEVVCEIPQRRNPSTTVP